MKLELKIYIYNKYIMGKFRVTTRMLMSISFKNMQADSPVWVSGGWLCPCWSPHPTHKPRCCFLQWWRSLGWDRRHTLLAPRHINSRTQQMSWHGHANKDMMTLYGTKKKQISVPNDLFSGIVSKGATVVGETPIEEATQHWGQEESVTLQDHHLFFQTRYLTHWTSWQF